MEAGSGDKPLPAGSEPIRRTDGSSRPGADPSGRALSIPAEIGPGETERSRRNLATLGNPIWPRTGPHSLYLPAIYQPADRGDNENPSQYGKLVHPEDPGKVQLRQQGRDTDKIQWLGFQ